MPRGPASTLPTDYKFTGQRSEEAGLGSLYDYGARFYSPALGRFLSPDTIVPSPGNPQSLNRYAYVLNNPLRYTDPTGHWVESGFDVISLGLTINDIRNEGFTLGNTVSLITDAASIALPIVPAGVSHALRAWKLANKAVNAADSVSDAVKLVNAADTVSDGARLTNKADNVTAAAIDHQVVLFNSPSNPNVPQTRPGRDGKVSCSACSPSEGIRNSFGREPTSADRYWEIDLNAVRNNGGQVVFDGGRPVTDMQGNPLGGSYPQGHVSLQFPGQSKGWVERSLPNWLRGPRKVLPE